MAKKEMKKRNGIFVLINIIASLLIVVGSIRIFFLKKRLINYKNQFKEVSNENNKNAALFRVSYKWLLCLYSKKNIIKFLTEQNVKNVAIYGMGYLGTILSKALQEKEINVAFGIDKSTDRIYTNIPIVCVEDINDEIDMIIVTPITSFEAIRNELEKYTSKPIVALDFLLNQV